MNKRVRIFNLVLSALLFMFCVPQTILFGIDPYNIREAGPPAVTNEGVLFTFAGNTESPNYVKVSGDFNNWEESFLMKKNRHNIFVFLFNQTKERGIVLDEGTYRYRYLSDGVWIKDPLNPNTVHDRYGTELSYFTVKNPIYIIRKNPIHLKHNTYVFYYKDDTAKKIYILGDFNNWNPYSLSMKRNRGGLWEVEVDIPPGTYAYRFIVDGKSRRDPYGTTVVYDAFDNELSLVTLSGK